MRTQRTPTKDGSAAVFAAAAPTSDAAAAAIFSAASTSIPTPVPKRPTVTYAAVATTSTTSVHSKGTVVTPAVETPAVSATGVVTRSRSNAYPPLPTPAAEWTIISSRRPRRRTSSDASNASASSTASSTSPLIKTFYVSGIPRDTATPKALDHLFKTVGLIPSNITVYANGTAVISSHQSDLREKLLAVGHQIGKPITVSSRRAPTRNAPAPKTPSFSCVIRGVEADITIADVKEALARQEVTFRQAWRIRSKATDRETRLIRVVTTCKASLDALLARGLLMFSHRYQAEASHAPKPQPTQCGRCLRFDHATGACQARRAVCGVCGQDHPTASCKPEATIKCGNCGGDDHVAFSLKCPNRPKEAVNVENAAPLKTVDGPTAEDLPATANDASLTTFIRFTVTSLLNLFPDRREQVQSILRPLIQQFFGFQVTTSYAGNYVHVSLTK